MKIVIIGACGFLGTKLISFLSQKNEVIGADIRPDSERIIRLDAADKNAVRNFLLKINPEIVIDTVALTSSVACEKNPKLAYKLNYLTAKNIAEVCKEINTKMIFISSTYLFDGKKGNYNEEDEIKPVNEYGRTKSLAEKEVFKLDKYLLIRLDVMYGYNGKDKPNGVFNWILAGDEVALREPYQIRQPILVEDVVSAINILIEKNKKGVFHLAGPTRIKMIDFLKKLETLMRKESKIKISFKKPEIEMKIPLNATLDISKMTKLGIKTCSLEEGIGIIRKQLSEF
jgi:dTDP-4-dehydrorhamnose reductase